MPESERVKAFIAGAWGVGTQRGTDEERRELRAVVCSAMAHSPRSETTDVTWCTLLQAVAHKANGWDAPPSTPAEKVQQWSMQSFFRVNFPGGGQRMDVWKTGLALQTCVWFEQ